MAEKTWGCSEISCSGTHAGDGTSCTPSIHAAYDNSRMARSYGIAIERAPPVYH